MAMRRAAALAAARNEPAQALAVPAHGRLGARTRLGAPALKFRIAFARAAIDIGQRFIHGGLAPASIGHALAARAIGLTHADTHAGFIHRSGESYPRRARLGAREARVDRRD